MDNKWKIRLTKPEDVKEFVYSAGKCDFDVDVFYNRIVVDAKSILGVLSLDLSNVLTVQYSGEDVQFEQILSKYCIA